MQRHLPSSLHNFATLTAFICLHFMDLYLNLLLGDRRSKEKRQKQQQWRHHPLISAGKAGWGGREVSHSRPWLPRGGATALGGWATELMGDVVIFLLSERQTNRHRKAERGGRKESGRRRNRERHRRKKMWKKSVIRIEGGIFKTDAQYRPVATRCQCLHICKGVTFAVFPCRGEAAFPCCLRT